MSDLLCTSSYLTAGEFATFFSAATAVSAKVDERSLLMGRNWRIIVPIATPPSSLRYTSSWTGVGATKTTYSVF